MLDTETEPEGIGADTPGGPYPRLGADAVERAKTRLGITDIGALGQHLGFSRMGFFRVRRGEQDVRLSHAFKIADQLDWPLDLIFERGTDA